MNKDIFVRCLLSEKVKLAASKLNKHFRDTILTDLKEKVEGVCTKHGYIRIDSVEIHSIQSGQVEMASLTGNVIVDVKFYADVCNPSLGNVIKCKVTNINKFGILAEVKPILEIIVAKNSVNIKSDVDLNTVQVGDDVFVEVVGKKYELMDKSISIIGRIIVSPQSAKYKKSIKSLASDINELAVEDDDIIDDGEEYEDDKVDADASDDEEGNEDKSDEVESEVDNDDEFDDVESDDGSEKGGKKIGGAEFFESDEENYDMFEGANEMSGSEAEFSEDGSEY